MCFWGEYFNFPELPKVEKITILIYKDKGKVRRQRKPVGRIKISVASVQSRREVEKWYPVEKSSRRESPSIRLKCQFQSIDVLPLRDYEQLLKYLTDNYRSRQIIFGQIDREIDIQLDRQIDRQIEREKERKRERERERERKRERERERQIDRQIDYEQFFTKKKLKNGHFISKNIFVLNRGYNKS